MPEALCTNLMTQQRVPLRLFEAAMLIRSETHQSICFPQLPKKLKKHFEHYDWTF